MDLAICTIQRDRSPWIREWVAFHHLVGFRKFYIYLHRCADNSAHVVQELTRHFDITAFTIGSDVPRPQLSVYQHCYAHYGQAHDWMAFIDGDEFLFSPAAATIEPQLERLRDVNFSALGVYWSCFGSSGHQAEPKGLVIDNYRHRADTDFIVNQHIKSIVRGGLGDGFAVTNNAHYFQTPQGTIDTSSRRIVSGHTGYPPCVDSLRINHYVTQSREFFLTFKKTSGAADADPNAIRQEEWWTAHDRNEVFDTSLEHLRPALGELLTQL